MVDRYHLIVPSLPGFAYSSKPGPTDDFHAGTVAYLFNELMTGLGFKEYAAQGGDIGSRVSYDLGQNYPACRGELLFPYSEGVSVVSRWIWLILAFVAVHVNFKAIQSPPEGTPEYTKTPPPSKEIIRQMQVFGYGLEHATRPSTIGIVVGCNPMSLLAWYVTHFTKRDVG